MAARGQIETPLRFFVVQMTVMVTLLGITKAFAMGKPLPRQLWSSAHPPATRGRRLVDLESYCKAALFGALWQKLSSKFHLSPTRCYAAARSMSMANDRGAFRMTRMYHAGRHQLQAFRTPQPCIVGSRGDSSRPLFSSLHSTGGTGFEHEGDLLLPTVATVLKESLHRLQQSDVAEPVASATQLLATCLELPWETGYRDLLHIVDAKFTTSTLAQQRLTRTQLDHYHNLLERRLAHEPIQYLVGQWDFLEYTLAVKPPLLCPRPETEELVQLVLADLQKTTKNNEIRVLDVGCGTGCIGIALVDQLLKQSKQVHLTALDVEPIAVETSRQNAAKILDSWQDHYEVHLCDAADYTVSIEQDRFHVVVSNPPYIPAADMGALEDTVAQYESQQALYGGSTDGMHVIRTIVRKLSSWCRPGAICWMEVDPSHPHRLKEWLMEPNNDMLRVDFVESARDIFGRDRFVKLRVRPLVDSSTT